MKKWHFIFVLATLCCCFLPALRAQKTVDKTIENMQNGQYGTPAQRAADLDAAMRTNLGLSTEQAKKVHDINLRYAIRAENEVVKADISMWSKYTKLMAIQEAKDTELKAALSSEQFEKYTIARDAAFWKAIQALLL